MSLPKQKLYCYVDETGQDTKGKLFIVSVVIAAENRDVLKAILSTSSFKGIMCYGAYRSAETSYLYQTVLKTAQAVGIHASKAYEATIFIDGLPKSKVGWVGTELRHLNIRTKKVRGVKKEESDALMRLADSLCGFIRAALDGRTGLALLLETAKQKGFIKEL